MSKDNVRRNMCLIDRLDRMVLGAIEIVTGLVAIVTLGQWFPNWSWDYCVWGAKKRASTGKQSIPSEGE